MNRRWNWRVLFSIGLLCALPTWAWGVVPPAEPEPGATTGMNHPGEPTAQQGPPMQGKMGMHGMGMGGMKGMGGMGKRGMAGKAGMKPGREASGPAHGRWGVSGVMRDYHRWIGCLMSHAGDLGLDPEQMSRIDDAITAHRVAAIRYGAEVMALRVQVRHALRAGEIDLQAVNNLLMKLAEQIVRMQMEGISLHTEIQRILTPQQRGEAYKLCGPPIPPPWAEMAPWHSPGIPGGMMPSAEEEEGDQGGKSGQAEPAEGAHH